MSDLVSWLTKILDEDEAITREADVDAAITEFVNERQYGRLSVPISWVLADIAAKRAIIALHEGGVSYPEECGLCNEGLPCQTLRLVAQPYADRPGYDESWRP